MLVRSRGSSNPDGSNAFWFTAAILQSRAGSGLCWFTALLVQIPAGLQLDSLLVCGWLVRFTFVVRCWCSDLLVCGSAGSQFSTALLVRSRAGSQALASSKPCWFTALLVYSHAGAQPYGLATLLARSLAG